MLKVKSWVQTCGACPAQWEGTLDNGDCFYARFRFGHGYVATGKTMDDAIFGDVLVEWNTDGEYDGVMSTSELKEKTKGVLGWD